MKIGQIEILPVIDATFRHPPNVGYAGAPAREDAWDPHRYLLDEWGQLESSMGGFLLRDDSGLVALVDLGLGDNDMMGARSGMMLESLASHGLNQATSPTWCLHIFISTTSAGPVWTENLYSKMPPTDAIRPIGTTGCPTHPKVELSG